MNENEWMNEWMNGWVLREKYRFVVRCAVVVASSRVVISMNVSRRLGQSQEKKQYVVISFKLFVTHNAMLVGGENNATPVQPCADVIFFRRRRHRAIKEVNYK